MSHANLSIHLQPPALVRQVGYYRTIPYFPDHVRPDVSTIPLLVQKRKHGQIELNSIKEHSSVWQQNKHQK